jgi:multicomponent Na+:H+ antiporter subunit B
MWVFFLGAFGFAILFFLATSRMPQVGDFSGSFGNMVNQITIPVRHVTDFVSAVNFDYRAIDTLGEEFILFASVVGAVVLLREEEDKKQGEGEAEDKSTDRTQIPGPSESIQVWTLGLTGPTVLFGLYIVLHGQLTPGGGFQGGVILATAPLLIYLAGNFKLFKRVTSYHWIEFAEATGALGFLIIGLIPLLRGARFLENFLSYGSKGDPFSGGTMPLISAATGLEVAAGFTLLLIAFLQQTLAENKK